MKKCPSCGLVHPDESERCECGFNFASGARDPRMSLGVHGQLASVEARLAAQLIDGVIALSLYFVAIPVASLSESLVLLGPALFILYYLLSDALPGGQSLGKRLLKIAVVEESSDLPCTLAQSAMRNATQILGFFDWLWIFGSQRKRAGDFLAHTRVISLPGGWGDRAA